MDTIALRAAAGKLDSLHVRFAPCFGRRECQEHALAYVRGLLLAEGRKSVEPMALVFGAATDAAADKQHTVLAWQRFLTVSPWEAPMVQREIQAVFTEEFVPTAKQSLAGTVGIVDGSGFAKRGEHSVGVQRQWCGRLGKQENCQVGVFLVGATPGGSALLDHRLYLPESWAVDQERRTKTRVPAEVTFQTKPQIAADLLARCTVRFDWVTADEEFGRDGDFLDRLEQRGQSYVVEIPCNSTVWQSEPPEAHRQAYAWRADHFVESLPPTAWHTIVLREGTKGPLTFHFARTRVWCARHGRVGPSGWLLARRSLERDPEVKYYFSNASKETPLEAMAQASGTRWRVEEWFEEGKGDLGMADYEARSWTSWHHHMSLVALAHLFVTQTRREVRRDVPELTLDMALRIVRAALGRPRMTVDTAAELIEYHMARNRQARLSHRKSWLAKHPNAFPRK